MLQRVASKLRQSQVQQVQSALPPVRGINSTGAIAAMPPSDALQMDNFVSTDLGVSVREGWFEFATNIGGDASRPVRTIMSYEGAPAGSTTSPLTSSVLFAANDFGIFDIEAGGDMTSTVADIALSGGSNAGRFSFVQFTTAAGQYLVACSELDGGFLYNGVSWMKMTSVGGPGPGIITGVDPANFVQVCAWKKRLMFVQRGTSKVWILDVGSVGGVATMFDFGPLMQHGGMVLALINWTQDAGAGLDDKLVILGTSGDLIIYEGTDPTTAATFRNIGTWYIGQPPVGRRCYTTSGGNIFVLTQFGVIPVAQVIQGGLDNVLTSSTEYLVQLRKIQDLLNYDFRALLNVEGWELLELPSKATLLIARPPASVTDFLQYAFQMHNLAWSRFFDIPGRTFGRRLSENYCGTTDARVLRILEGSVDNLDLDGENGREVRARLTPAFTTFGTPTVQKQVLMMRLTFLSNQTPGYSIRMNTDYSVTALGGTQVAGASEGALWDAAFWDVDVWAGGRVSYAEWRSVEGMGFALAPSIFVSSEQPTTLVGIDYMLKAGGPF